MLQNLVKYKGKRFEVPRTFKARPTTDFAKENLFNVLRAYVDFDETHALDLFAGTGSITLELLSRGCPEVVSVERDRQHFAFISQVLRSLADPAARPVCADALRYIQRATRSFELVFADPPYALRELPELPEMVLHGTLVAPEEYLSLSTAKTTISAIIRFSLNIVPTVVSTSHSSARNAWRKRPLRTEIRPLTADLCRRSEHPFTFLYALQGFCTASSACFPASVYPTSG